jgi:prepilin-type N-terminal cleavage/methylation domain-containing protein
MGAARRRGLTLIEMMVTLTILSIVGIAVYLVTRSSAEAYQSASMAQDVESAGRRTTARIKDYLRSAGATTVSPASASPFSSTQIDFQRAIDGGGWGDPERIQLQLMAFEKDDGDDDNGNGLVDEGRIVWIQNPGAGNERSVVLCNGIREYLEGEQPNGKDDNGNGLVDERGLCFAFEDGRVVVRFTIERVDLEGESYNRTFEATIAFRN